MSRNTLKKRKSTTESSHDRSVFNTNTIIKRKQVEDEAFTMNMWAFNARTLRNKIQDTWKFPSENTVHLLAVSKSWLGESVPDSSVTIPGFHGPFLNDENERGCGVWLYVSNNIPCRRRTDLERPDLELVWIEILKFMRKFLSCRLLLLTGSFLLLHFTTCYELHWTPLRPIRSYYLDTSMPSTLTGSVAT